MELSWSDTEISLSSFVKQFPLPQIVQVIRQFPLKVLVIDLPAACVLTISSWAMWNSLYQLSHLSSPLVCFN